MKKASMAELTALLDALLGAAREAGLQLPPKVILGGDAWDIVGGLARPYRRAGRVLGCLGGRHAQAAGLPGRMEHGLRAAGFTEIIWQQVAMEPTVAMCDAAVQAVRQTPVDLVVSLGGGSVMDLGKAVAALAPNAGLALDYLEGIGRGRALAVNPLPHIAIPTLAGTGAEATKNAVLKSEQHQVKRSIRDDRMIPVAVILDAGLMCSAPPAITAAGGMDTITQLIEPCITAKRKPAVTALALAGLRLAGWALPACHENGAEREARAAMALAGFLSGVCLANAGLALVHGVAAPMGAMLGLPHGLVCGILLPHMLRYNREAAPAALASALAALLGEETPDAGTVGRGIAWIEDMNRRFGIPADLKHLRLSEPQQESLAAQSTGANMANNPVPMTPEKTADFLRAIC